MPQTQAKPTVHQLVDDLVQIAKHQQTRQLVERLQAARRDLPHHQVAIAHHRANQRLNQERQTKAARWLAVLVQNIR